ncbi:hypothetical protein SLE2022_306190 [Rubroshorea leprosula]
MADGKMTPPVFFPVTAIHQILCLPKAAESSSLIPFSAVAPAQFLTVSRLHIHITLETIQEEENEEESGKFLPQDLSVTPFLSPCFLEVQKTPLSSYSQMA